MEFYPSLASIAAKYDGFILDLWGVIHDGTALYPGAKTCLEALKRAGKRVVFLSNAPKRAVRVQEMLDGMGITRDLYHHVLSSGELAYHFLAEPQSARGRNTYYYLGPEDDDAKLLDGLHYERAHTLSEATFILGVDVEYRGQEVRELESLLTEARHCRLPLICVNPDKEVVKQTGERLWCAGAVAEYYERMGGEVSYFGKPYPAVYETAITLLDSIKRDAILAVGDNIATDIAGASQMGLASALVTGGILALEMGATPDPYALRERCERLGHTPDYVIPGFVYSHR